jgi:cell division protein FtsX
MRSDDLRRALYMTFDGSDPDAEVARRRVEQRVHRQRQRFASVVVLVAVLVAGAVVGLARIGRDDKVGVATEPPPHEKLVAVDDVRRADVAVDAPDSSTLSTLQAIELAMERSASIERYARVPAPVLTCPIRQRWFVDVARGTDLAALRSSLGHGVSTDGEWRAHDRTTDGGPSLFVSVGTGEHRADVEIFMTVRATDAAIAHVRGVLAKLAVARSVRYLDKAAAYAEFKRIFRDSPDLVRNVSPAALPVSFRVDVDRRADRETVRRAVESLPGVDQIVMRDAMAEDVQPLLPARALGTSEAEVFMRVDATATEVRSVGHRLAADSAVRSVDHLDKQRAFAEFRRTFGDSPDLIAALKPADLPESFRVRIEPVDQAAFRARAETYPGVGQVAVADPGC